MLELKQVQNFVETAESKLQKSGYKITGPREDVLKLFATSEKALSAYEIQAELAKTGRNYEVITIYRILELLAELELIHKLYAINGFVKCEPQCHHHHHKFLICTNCHHVEKLNLPKKRQTASCEDSFQTSTDINEALGLCHDCAD